MKVIYSLGFFLSSHFAQRIINLVDKESKHVSFFDLYLLPDNNFYPTSNSLHAISKLSHTCLFTLAVDETGGHFLWWDTTIPAFVFPLTSERYIFCYCCCPTHGVNKPQAHIWLDYRVVVWGHSLNCAGSNLV